MGLFPKRVMITLAIAAATAAAVGQSCPAASIPTACGPTQTCCPTFESLSGYGCCDIPGAVCCPAGPETQMCCPPGTTCVNEGYGASCMPSGGGANATALHVCPPGAANPPSSGGGLPSVIVIGDSVSEGYEPTLAANLSSLAYVQHSPYSTGGGADDVFHGVDCQENWLRTADYNQANWTLITFNFVCSPSVGVFELRLTQYPPPHAGSARPRPRYEQLGKLRSIRGCTAKFYFPSATHGQ